jgi:hypothetical protein
MLDEPNEKPIGATGVEKGRERLFQYISDVNRGLP